MLYYLIIALYYKRCVNYGGCNKSNNYDEHNEDNEQSCPQRIKKNVNKEKNLIYQVQYINEPYFSYAIIKGDRKEFFFFKKKISYK